MKYEIVERVGVSTESYSHAVDSVIKETNTEKPISWFETVEFRGRVLQDGKLEYQARVKIGRAI